MLRICHFCLLAACHRATANVEQVLVVLGPLAEQNDRPAVFLDVPDAAMRFLLFSAWLLHALTSRTTELHSVHSSATLP